MLGVVHGADLVDLRRPGHVPQSAVEARRRGRRAREVGEAAVWERAPPDQAVQRLVAVVVQRDPEPIDRWGVALPAVPDRSHHRIPNANRHPIRMGTKQSAACARRAARKGPRLVEVAVHHRHELRHGQRGRQQPGPPRRWNGRVAPRRCVVRGEGTRAAAAAAASAAVSAPRSRRPVGRSDSLFI